MRSQFQSIIARSLLIGVIGVSLGIILAVSGVSIKIVKSKSDWKNYTNREFQFSFRYPPDWKFYREENKSQITIKVSDGRESFSAVMRGPDILSVQGFSHSAVIAGKNALVIDRTSSDRTKIYREAYFYEPEGFRITISTDSSLSRPLVFEVLKTFQFLK